MTDSFIHYSNQNVCPSMARVRAPDRLDHVLESATDIFIHRGYRQTQMADVARASEIAQGTLYLYFKSKQALFNTVVRRAFLGEAFKPPTTLPVATQSEDELLAFIRQRYDEEWRVIELEAALTVDTSVEPVTDVRSEFEGIVSELYQAMHRYRFAIRVVEKSSDDWPALYALHFDTMRRRVVSQLIQYLELRISQGLLAPVPNAEAAIGVVLETVSWFAMHRHFARHPNSISDEAAHETVVHLLSTAFTAESLR